MTRSILAICLLLAACSQSKAAPSKEAICNVVDNAARVTRQSCSKVSDYVTIAIKHNRHALTLDDELGYDEKCAESIRVGRMEAARGGWLQAWVAKQKAIGIAELVVVQRKGPIDAAGLLMASVEGPRREEISQAIESYRSHWTSSTDIALLLGTKEFGTGFGAVSTEVKSWRHGCHAATEQLVKAVCR